MGSPAIPTRSWARPGLASLLCLAALASSCGGPRPMEEAFRLPSERTIFFADRLWHLRAPGRGGPGPNLWTDDPRAIFTDGEGRLHLRALPADPNQRSWHCVELWTALPSGWPRAEVRVSTPIDALPVEAVVGIFLYRNDDSELDVELGRFGLPDHPGTQFAVSPQLAPGHRYRFPPPPGPTHHTIAWAPEGITFEARGETGREITWTFAGEGRPEPDAHELHLNLWFAGGVGPKALEPVEIVVDHVAISVGPASTPAGNPGGAKAAAH